MPIAQRVTVIFGTVIFGILLGTLVGAPTDAAAGQPQERDVWYVQVAGGQPYGSDHVTVRRLENGTFVYEVERRALLDLIGQRQEISEKAKYVVTADCLPISLSVERKSLSGPSRLQGHVAGEQFIVDYQREGLRRQASFDLSSRPLFQACLDDWLNSQPAGASKAVCRIIDESSLTLEPCTATRERGNATAWTVDMGPELGRGQLRFDADGIRRESEYRVPKHLLQRSTAEAASQIKHHKFAGREGLMFAVDKPITPPDRLTALTVRLTWKDIPFEQLQLEDERQCLMSRFEENGRCQAVISIRPAPTGKSDLTLPVEDPQFRPWLAESRYIKPADPDIARQARQWIGEEKSALEAVRLLSAAVFKHMQGGSLIAETLSGPETLQCKQGKCSEFAILFASLARSAGIPTRIVLGTRLMRGSWVGHMWNEAYVGRWVTVDSTVDEVGGGCALLKLTHSDSVLGTQAIRWQLAESLDVAVESFDPPAPLTTGGHKTGIDGLAYTNVEYACRLTAPNPLWSVQDVTPKAGAPSLAGLQPPVIRFKIVGHDDVSIHFVPMNVPPAFTPAMLVDTRSAQFKRQYPGYEVLRNAKFPLPGMTGQILVFRRAGIKDKASVMKTTEVLWTDGNSSFILNLIADEKSHDEFAAQFFELLASFETLAASAPAERQ